MAEALSNVLAEPGKHLNKTYEITGSKAYSFSEIAAVASGFAGKLVNYILILPR